MSKVGPIFFDCPECGSELQVPRIRSGKKIRCQDCDESVLVPGRKVNTEATPLRWPWIAGGALGVLLSILLLVWAFGGFNKKRTTSPTGEVAANQAESPANDAPGIPSPKSGDKATPAKKPIAPVLQVSIPEVNKAKSDAEAAWEPLQGIDRGQGVGKRLDEVKFDLRSGQTFYQEKDLAGALNAYRLAAQKCQHLSEIDSERQRARKLRDQASETQQAADRVKADTEATAVWLEAQQAARQADQAFQAGDFKTAQSNWQKAVASFATARTEAEGQRLVKDARASYESDLKKTDARKLESEGGDSWSQANAAVAVAEKAAREKRFAEAVDSYQDAQRLLKDAQVAGRFPQLHHWAFVAGFTGCTIEVLTNEGNAPDARLLAALKIAHGGLGLNTSNVDRLRDDRTVTQASLQKVLMSDVVGPIEKEHGPDISGGFVVGSLLARFWIHMQAKELNPKANVPRDNVLLVLQIVIQSAKKAGYPQEITDSFEKVKRMLDASWSQATIRECNAILRSITTKLAQEESAVKLFRQARPTSTPVARKPKEPAVVVKVPVKEFATIEPKREEGDPKPALGNFRNMVEQLKQLKEPARGQLFSLPEAVGLLDGVDKDKGDTVAVRTYSTTFNEKTFVAKYGKPDSTGRNGGFKTLRYDWLEIAVDGDGEIRFAIRALKPKKPGEFQMTITIDSKVGR